MIIHCNSVRYIWEVLENNEYNMVFNDLVVIDAGCNIGTFSLWIYPRAKTIHAVDYVDEHLDNLRKTIKSNNLSKIIVYKERLLTLNDFMSGHSIPVVDILKLDIEGDEIEVLSNNFPIDRVRTIVGEYHEKPVKEILERLGYRYFEYPNQHFAARI